jgi:uncharacterized damage-inducible protein DinB
VRSQRKPLLGLETTLNSALVDRYSTNAARVRELAESLSEEDFWTKPFAFGNSFGHLVLHLTGNLSYYIGSEIANTGYVRERPREFTESNPPSKATALQRFDDAVAMAVQTILSQSDKDWETKYQAVGTDCRNRLEIVFQCAAHMQHHIGQMIYLCQEWQRRQGATKLERSVT